MAEQHMTRDGLPCPGTCVTQADEAVEAQETIRELRQQVQELQGQLRYVSESHNTYQLRAITAEDIMRKVAEEIGDLVPIPTCEMSDAGWDAMMVTATAGKLKGWMRRLYQEEQQDKPALGCQHGRPLGRPCPHCMGFGAASPRPTDGDVLRALLDWYMCSDPWPVKDNKGHGVITSWLDKFSKQAGYSNWVDAYHRQGTKRSTSAASCGTSAQSKRRLQAGDE